MYEYRKLTAEERAKIVSERMDRGHPWHAPPHFEDVSGSYFLTAACFEHKEILTSPSRLTELAQVLVEGTEHDVGGKVHAWVVLPTHYHLLAEVDLDRFRRWIGRLHNGKSTQWNREDRTPGRQVWYRFMDRLIRSRGHYYASLNYIHGNPVKHGYVKRADDWPWSSFHEYLERVGRQTLRRWWRVYPVGAYGQGWDDG